MTKTIGSTHITSLKRHIDDTEMTVTEGSEEWNEALERAYETFMHDLKSSTNNMESLSEWFASNPSLSKKAPSPHQI